MMMILFWLMTALFAAVAVFVADKRFRLDIAYKSMRMCQSKRCVREGKSKYTIENINWKTSASVSDGGYVHK